MFANRMNMDMSPMTWCGPLPFYFRVGVVAIFLWPLVTPMAIARRCDLRAFAIAPLGIGTLGAALGSWHVAQSATISGSRGAALAAGTAENLVMPMLGALMTGLISIALTVLPRIEDVRRARTRGSEAIMALSGGALLGVTLQRAFFPMIALSGASLLAILTLTLIRARSRQPRSGRFAFIGIALASFSASFALWRLIEHYGAIALGRA